MMPLCAAEGIGVLPWSPLARGRLTRAWKSETTKRTETDQYAKILYSGTEDADKQVVDRLGEVAKRRRTPHAQVALAWLLAKPIVAAPIVGATKPHHLDATSALSVKLTPEEIQSLEEPTWRIRCSGSARLYRKILARTLTTP